MNAKEITIKTNRIPRPLVSFFDLSKKEQEGVFSANGVDFPKREEWEDGIFERDAELLMDRFYFKFKGELFSTADFNRISPPSANDPNLFAFQVPEDHPWVLNGWKGADHEGRGILVKFPTEDSVIVGVSDGY